MSTYGWVDKAKGTAHIPISDAMKLTMIDLAKTPPKAANPIPPEAITPGAQAQAAAAASPAPAPAAGSAPPAPAAAAPAATPTPAAPAK